MGIIGGGVAGKAAAIAIANNVPHASIDLFAGDPTKDGGPFDAPVGLWEPSLQAAERVLGKDVYERLVEGRPAMGKCGYRSMDAPGAWLAGPGGGEEGDALSVPFVFVPTSSVEASLDGLLDARVGKVEVHTREWDEDGNADDAGAYDVVVDGSGTWSSLRAKAGGSDPTRLGYSVARGVSRVGASVPDRVAAQWWAGGDEGSPRMRFAAAQASLPKEDGGGEDWVWFVTVQDGSGDQGGGCAVEMARGLMAGSPLEEHPFVRGLMENVLAQESWDHRDGGPFCAVASDPWAGVGTLVPVGDAARTLDPILAQGMGLAFEDAALLGASLGQMSTHGVSLDHALSNYRSSFLQRGANAVVLSRIVQYLGQDLSFLSARLRDRLLHLTPSFVSKPVFDHLSHLALR